MKTSPASIKNAIIARDNASNHFFDLDVTLPDGTVVYLNVDKDTARATTYKDGTWADLYTLATKSDLVDAATYNPILMYDGSKTVAAFCQSVKSGTTAVVYVPSRYTTEVTGLPTQDGYYITVYKSTISGYGIFDALSIDGARKKCIESNGVAGGWS